MLLALVLCASDIRAQLAFEAWPRAEEADGALAGRMGASLLVPGAGQALDGQPWLSAAFFGVEIATWWIALDGRADGRRLRGDYRDFAWEVARGQPIPRVEGSFEYYERLTQWGRSGQFDASPDPGLQPERASDAYNGRQWRLAADIFLQGDLDAPPTASGYGSALAYYRDRAYPAELAWDWSGDDASQRRFSDLIRASDDAFRRSSIAVGAVVANHLLSAIEVYVHRRLGREAVAMSVAPGIGPAAGGTVLTFRILP